MENRTRVDIVIKSFFKDINDCKIIPFGSGLIHRTFFLELPEGDFILQNLNHNVFEYPMNLMENIELVGQYLASKSYPKSILEIRKTLDGKLILQTSENEFWRVFNFINETEYFSKANSIEQVYETGKSFGEFLYYLHDLPIKKIKPSIPDFHNTSLRLKKLEKAIKKDKFNRCKFAKKEIEQIRNWAFLINEFNALNCPPRVVHADPKINNLLFDKNKKVKAVIDWDTIMVGNILHDFGDLVRTTACALDEESLDFENVKISPTYFEALKKGFLESTNSWLTEDEKDNLLLGGKIIIYEQAIRFLTDFLEGDRYYSTINSDQNLNRTKNQIALCKTTF